MLLGRLDRQQRNRDEKLNWTSEASQQEKNLREAQQAFEEVKLANSEHRLEQEIDSLARLLRPYMDVE